jgi:squalene synthase HpnC
VIGEETMSGSSSTTHEVGGPWANARIDELTAKARDENFPVATRLLPRRQRAHLFALYAFARLVDDVGDELEGDRLAALDWLDRELSRAFSDEATHPVFIRLQHSIRACGLEEEPFRNLIEANRRDQRIASYTTFEELVDYCTLSANPIGRLVLRVFDADTATRVAWSDDVCTALQIIEHLQDVGEDARRGRVYLPLEDREAKGCTIEDLTGTVATPSLRRAVARESARARGLLDSASPLLQSLSGRPRLAIAGFAAGGLAALDAIAAVDFDVLGHRCRPTRRRLVLHMLKLRVNRHPGGIR